MKITSSNVALQPEFSNDERVTFALLNSTTGLALVALVIGTSDWVRLGRPTILTVEVSAS